MIALECYHQIVPHVDSTQENYDKDMHLLLLKAPDTNRLKSSILNNQGIMMFLSICESSNPLMRMKTIKYIDECFEQAL